MEEMTVVEKLSTRFRNWTWWPLNFLLFEEWSQAVMWSSQCDVFRMHLLLGRTYCMFLPESTIRYREHIKVKLSPTYNLSFFCVNVKRVKWVKHSCKSIITMKEALLTFTVVSFSGPTHFQWECLGQISDSIKIAIFKTLRKLDTTWNFACSITRVSTHEHEHWEHC